MGAWLGFLIICFGLDGLTVIKVSFGFELHLDASVNCWDGLCCIVFLGTLISGLKEALLGGRRLLGVEVTLGDGAVIVGAVAGLTGFR